MVQITSFATVVLAIASCTSAWASPAPGHAAGHRATLGEGFEKRVRRAVAPLEERDLEERAVPNAKFKRAFSANYYSALVAVGASYTDNAHWRDSKYAGSLRDYAPYNKYGGRYSNGPVAVEYMVKSDASPALKQQQGGVKLVDYAYGGSVVENGLSGTGSSWPAAKDQVASYLSDLKAGKAAVGSGRVLHYFNSGINPVTQIWNNALSAGLSSDAIAKAKAGITANIQSYAAAMRSINKDSAAVAKLQGGVDFLLVGIPQMDLVPSIGYQVPGSYSSAKRSQALDLMKTLSNQYNSELKALAAALKSENKNGRVFYYDLAALWSSMHSSPKSFGITAGASSTCYNSSTGGVCGNPASYLYFDTLHPVTSVHKLMAQKMNALVLGTSS
ncbi:uncharacterized protein JCM10292_005057 [Rhodotorula paludigena]|uniref:uncharacterized protein n=1 Tax=Rhodotorula paludigena TaxID=86838 RepID=UPI00316CBC82